MKLVAVEQDDSDQSDLNWTVWDDFVTLNLEPTILTLGILTELDMLVVIENEADCPKKLTHVRENV